MQLFTGIDFSITSPAISTIMPDKIFIRCISPIKKLHGTYAQDSLEIEILPYPSWENEYQRYKALSQLLLSDFPLSNPIFLEDYAFAAKGVVFNIAEATWELKRTLYEQEYQIEKIPPTQLKKFATGKGNAKKADMYVSLLSNKNINISSILNMPSEKSPVSDCVDALFLAFMNKESC